MRSAMTKKDIDEKIGEGLVRRGLMTQEQVTGILAEQKKGDKRLFGEIALEKSFIRVRSLMDYLRERES